MLRTRGCLDGDLEYFLLRRAVDSRRHRCGCRSRGCNCQRAAVCRDRCRPCTLDDLRLCARVKEDPDGGDSNCGATAIVLDGNAALNQRRAALAALSRAQSPALLPALLKLLASTELRGDALRALGTIDDSRVPQAILAVYGELSVAERRDALATLCGRPAYAAALLDAVMRRHPPPAAPRLRNRCRRAAGE